MVACTSGIWSMIRYTVNFVSLGCSLGKEALGSGSGEV